MIDDLYWTEWIIFLCLWLIIFVIAISQYCHGNRRLIVGKPDIILARQLAGLGCIFFVLMAIMKCPIIIQHIDHRGVGELICGHIGQFCFLFAAVTILKRFIKKTTWATLAYCDVAQFEEARQNYQIYRLQFYNMIKFCAILQILNIIFTVISNVYFIIIWFLEFLVLILFWSVSVLTFGSMATLRKIMKLSYKSIKQQLKSAANMGDYREHRKILSKKTKQTRQITLSLLVLSVFTGLNGLDFFIVHGFDYSLNDINLSTYSISMYVC